MQRKKYTITYEREHEGAPLKQVKTNVKLEAPILEQLRVTLSLLGFATKDLNKSFAKDLSARVSTQEQIDAFNECPIGGDLFNFHMKKIEKQGYSKITAKKMRDLTDYLAKYGGYSPNDYKVQPKPRNNAKAGKQKPTPTHSTKTIAPEAVGAYLEKIQTFGNPFFARMFELKDMFYITEKLKKAKEQNTNLVVASVWYERLQIIYNYNPQTNE
jgi:hypothetical protein